MATYQLEITLKSETTFSRGDGQAGVVDIEVQHDAIGCPYWSGRAIKGILVNECAEILDALGGEKAPEQWLSAAETLFGRPGNAFKSGGWLSIGEAHLPDDLRELFAWQLRQRIARSRYDGITAEEMRSVVEIQRELFRKQLLDALTSMHSQTALEEDGSAREHSLRTNRVLLRDLIFLSDLQTSKELTETEKGLLAACVMAMRTSGSSRNRGKGAISTRILNTDGKPITRDWFSAFKGGI